MPYPIGRLSRVGLASLAAGITLFVSVGALGLAAGPALADGPGSGGWSGWTNGFCGGSPLTQAFLNWGDQNYYMTVRGQDGDGFEGDGWTLSGGASIETAQLSDGSTGNVLDMPSGSVAVSPLACINLNYPDARMMVNDVSGDEGVELYTSYRDLGSWGSNWTAPVDSGNANGAQDAWQPSDPLNLPAPSDSNWQLARFTLVAGGTTSEFQIYDFSVDPYSRG